LPIVAGFSFFPEWRWHPTGVRAVTVPSEQLLLPPPKLPVLGPRP
jgi:hypothetical protein